MNPRNILTFIVGKCSKVRPNQAIQPEKSSWHTFRLSRICAKLTSLLICGVESVKNSKDGAFYDRTGLCQPRGV